MRQTVQVIVIIAISLFLISCQSGNNQTAPQKTNDDEQLIHVKNASPTEKEQLTNNEIAVHLSNIAGQIQDVNDAASIVVGPYAVVGIDIAQDLDRQRVGTIKYSVAEALRNDPYGKTAVVIADGDLLERFRQMSIDIQNGRPIHGVVEELAEIVNRYMPDVPVEEDKYDDNDAPNHLPEKDEEELKDIQKEQSNDHN